MDISSTTITSISNSNTDDLSKARVSKGYTIDQLAIATGLTEQEIRHAEEGRGRLSVNYVRRIRSALR